MLSRLSMFRSLFAIAVAVSVQQQRGSIFARAQSSSSSSLLVDGCVTDYDETVDYFPDKAVIEFAQTFTVEYFNSYKVLTIMTALEGNATYVLYQCGTPQPNVTDVDVQLYVSTPVTSVATGTSDHIPRLELLGQRDSIVAYVNDVDLIGSPCVDALVEDGTIDEAITYDANCGNVTDNDALESLGVEVTFVDSLAVSLYCENSTLGDVYNGVALKAYEETGETAGLGEGEFIKLFSLFYNGEAAANEIFDEIESLWFCTKNNAQGCSLQLNNTPSVAWFSYVPTNPIYSDYQAGWGPPSADAYYAYAIENAGGLMTTCPNATAYMSDEDMLACFGDADVCVFGADYAEVEAAMNMSALEQLGCVSDKRVYDITLSGINGWFEAKTVEPHVLIEDIVVVLHGDDFNYGIGDYERLLMRNVFTEESESGTYYPDEGTCADPNAALEIQGECDLIIDFDTCDTPISSDGSSHAVKNAILSWSTLATAAFVGACGAFLVGSAAAVTA